MTHNPYTNLPGTQFWSSGVKAPVSDQLKFDIEPLTASIAEGDCIVSGGSCFAQYIGEELTTRGLDYLRSNLSGERVESFGLGNIYTVAQLKQWLEFALGHRVWSDDCCFESDGQWYDLLLPHRLALSSKDEIELHRIAVKDEILGYLKKANVFVFTVGLTEAWQNSAGDIFPICPGTLVGEYDETLHRFHNYEFNEVYSDLLAVEKLLVEIHEALALVLTVSPVPLTATASGNHILLATTYSKSVIRAAVGQFCHGSVKATYFPSFEIISHAAKGDQRFDNNLRSISATGVRYVMDHAFAEERGRSVPLSDAKEAPAQVPAKKASCEEELLESHARLKGMSSPTSKIVLAGDCLIGKLAKGLRATGVDVSGGIVMHGSAFVRQKFELCEEKIFMPVGSEEATELWLDRHAELTLKKGRCDIVTNIGFQTHITINNICNHIGNYVLTEANVADYFDEFYMNQVYILSELAKLGKTWLIEDPDFHAFIGNASISLRVRDKNFRVYCNYMRKIANYLGIEYLNPCDLALQRMFKDSYKLGDIIASDGFGTSAYYEYCATVVSDVISGSDSGSGSGSDSDSDSDSEVVTARAA